MAVTLKSIKLWRKEVDNKSGELANTLGPLVAAGADLQVLMGYRYPGNESKAAIELYPVTGKKTTAAAEAAGFRASEIPCLFVEGDNKPGVAQAIAKAVSDAEINMSFIVAQAVGIGKAVRADLRQRRQPRLELQGVRIPPVQGVIQRPHYLA